MPAPALTYTIEVPPEQLAALKAQLSAQQVQKATFLAVKDATKGGVTDIKRILRKKTFINKEYIGRVVTPHPPTGDPPVGRITISRKRVPLIGFKVRATKRGGVTAFISRDKPTLKLRHGFLATVRNTSKTGEISEHTGVFTRAKGTTTGRKLTAAGYVGRLPIFQVYGPAVVDLVSVPETFAAIATSVKERFEKRLFSKLGWLAGQNAAAGGGDSD